MTSVDKYKPSTVIGACSTSRTVRCKEPPSLQHLRHAHASRPRRQHGPPYLILTNDHASETRSISLSISGDEGGRVLNVLVKDKNRMGVVLDRTFVTACAPEQTPILDTLIPLALRVYTTSSVKNYDT